MPIMQRRVYIGQFDKAGNLAQVGHMTVRKFQQDFKTLRGQKISLDEYRTFNQKHQMVVLEKQAA